jgi:hypothetical protein
MTNHGRVADNAFKDFCVTYALPKYEQILGYDHVTLTNGSEQNAIELFENLTHPVPPLDIVPHNRGGLVARCRVEVALPEMESSRNENDRLILVGTPNLGTELATPQHLKEAIDLFTNLVYYFLEFRLAIIAHPIGWLVKV